MPRCSFSNKHGHPVPKLIQWTKSERKPIVSFISEELPQHDYKNCLDDQIFRDRSLLNQHDSSLGCKMSRHANAQKFKRSLSQNQEPIRSKILYEYQCPDAFCIVKVKSQEDQQFCSLNFSDVLSKHLKGVTLDSQYASRAYNDQRLYLSRECVQ